MRKRFMLLAAVAAGCLVAAVAAWAGNPNFQRYKDPVLVNGDPGASALRIASTTAASSVNDPRVLVDGIVVVGVKEGATTRLTAPFKAVYVCVDGGGNVPSPDHHTVLVLQMETSAVFPAAKNGKAEGSLLTGPLPSGAAAGAATGFSCPSGLTLEFDRVVFSGLVLSIDGGEVVKLDTILESDSVYGVS